MIEQIYYTQCPIGYGLGASNGFQIKRLSAGYPVSGDFRHLGMRAFLPGGRTLAPNVLRYRRDGDVAEVACLTPRAREYETERGLWGRPGGHFAHGVRLPPEALLSLANGPAGLIDAPFWRRSDPEPSRGRPPVEISIKHDDLNPSRIFALMTAHAEGVDPTLLATLLTALAAVVREGRTLFLIDEPERLPGRIALLTFAFPASMRSALTFSTYHDRPEELPGFRIQGTAPAARPNRAVLVGLGVVADLTTVTFEPRVEPAPWALTLAGWLTQGGKDDEQAWTKTEARAARARVSGSSRSGWSDAWLDRLIAFQDGCRVPATLPNDAVGWTRLADLAGWSGRAGLADEWLIRGPSWWKEAVSSAPLPEARAALVAHGSLREAWAGPKGLAPAWGETVAAWFAPASAEERFSAALAFLRAAPGSARLPWLHAFLQAMPGPIAAESLDRLKTGRSIDPTLLLPMEVRAAVASVVNGTGDARLRDVLARAFDAPNALEAVLDALGSEVNNQPEAIGPLAIVLADALDASHDSACDAVRSWTLRRDDADAWLAPHLRRLFASPDLIDSWRILRDRTPNDLQSMLACSVLAVAQDPTLPGEVFRWGVDDLLLSIDESRRPRDPDWPNLYLSKVSGLELVHGLFSKRRRQPEVRRWLDAARTRGELSAEGLARLDRCRDYVRALTSGQAESLLGVALPDVTAREQGTLLGELVSRLGHTSPDGLFLCLDACINAWPDAFQPRAPGLAS
ncbi:MAG: hypothetical protein ABI353_08905, partial [Isosphaeraceae bacterium]